MNSALSKPKEEALLPRECELLKTISKLHRQDQLKSYRLVDLAEISGFPLPSLHRLLKALENKGRIEIEKVSGMRFTVKEPT